MNNLLKLKDLPDNLKNRLRTSMLLIFTCDKKCKNPQKTTDRFLTLISNKEKTKIKWRNYVYWKEVKAEKAKQLIMKGGGKSEKN